MQHSLLQPSETFCGQATESSDERVAVSFQLVVVSAGPQPGPGFPSSPEMPTFAHHPNHQFSWFLHLSLVRPASSLVSWCSGDRPSDRLSEATDQSPAMDRQRAVAPQVLGSRHKFLHDQTGKGDALSNSIVRTLRDRPST